MSTCSQLTRGDFSPIITVLIPAFDAQEFICETLDSLSKQTFKSFAIYISIDKSSDDTERVIKKWHQEHKDIPIEIFCQKDHLGWIENTNFLLKQCQTNFFMILPHDDIIAPKYMQKTLDCLKTNPYACVAYSDIKGFGTESIKIKQSSITGSRAKRIHDFLTCCFPAVAFRGLVNRKMLSNLLLLPKTRSDFAIDTVWNLQMALKGELIRIPEVLYYKRYGSKTVHAAWKKESDIFSTWLLHCQDCLNIISCTEFDQNELFDLKVSVRSRLLQDIHPLWNHDEMQKLPLLQKELLVSDLFKNDADSTKLQIVVS